MQRFESFVGGITELYRLIQRIKNTEMAPLGLAGRHVMCLSYLGSRSEGLTAGELCALCGEDKAAVSRTAADLERRGLIQRSGSYRATLRLTQTGRDMAGQVAELSRGAVEFGGAGLTDSQRETFYEAMDIISANLRAFCAREEARTR